MSDDKRPTHIDEADHLRMQLAMANQQIAKLNFELVCAQMAAKYGEGEVDPTTREIKRPTPPEAQ